VSPYPHHPYCENWQITSRQHGKPRKRSLSLKGYDNISACMTVLRWIETVKLLRATIASIR